MSGCFLEDSVRFGILLRMGLIRKGGGNPFVNIR
jgi:hypothetical protein